LFEKRCYICSIKSHTKTQKMRKELTFEKPINKMSKLELMGFINTIAPLLNHLPSSTKGSRVLAENLYQKYIAGENMPVAKCFKF